jgi:hypothetical protein
LRLVTKSSEGVPIAQGSRLAKSTIGKLSVQLTANTAGFQRAMSRAGKTMARIGKQAARVGAAVGAVGAAGLAAAAGGLAALTRQGLAAGDALGKNADRLGVSTEALAGLQHGAELAGVSQEALTKSLGRFNRSLGEAMQGTGPAAEALEALGLSADDLASMGADAAVGQVADKLNELGTTAEKSRVAFDLFGRSGIDMFTLFQGGSEGIAAASEEAERLGLAISRTDAAGIERANDAMTRLRRVFSGIGMQLAVRLAPILENAATMMQKVATEGGGIGPKVTNALRAVIDYAASFADGIDALREGTRALTALWLDWKATALEAIAAVGAKLNIVAAIANAANPAAGGAILGIGNYAQFGHELAREQADAAAGGIALGSDERYGNRIRTFGRDLLYPTQGPPTKADTDRTTEAVEENTRTLARKVDDLKNELQQLGSGSVNTQLLRLMDKLVLATSNARAPIAGGAGTANLGRAVAFL